MRYILFCQKLDANNRHREYLEPYGKRSLCHRSRFWPGSDRSNAFCSAIIPQGKQSASPTAWGVALPSGLFSLVVVASPRILLSSGIGGHLFRCSCILPGILGTSPCL